MQSFKFAKPLGCRQVQGSLPSFIYDKLSLERQGEIKGHLLSCDSCFEKYETVLEEAIAANELTIPEVAESPAIPEFLLYPSEAAKQKVGINWQIASQYKDRLMKSAQDLYSQTSGQLRDLVQILDAMGDNISPGGVYLSGDEIETRLLDSLKSPQKSKRIAAIKELSKHSLSPAIVDALADKFFNDADEKIRRQAGLALAKADITLVDASWKDLKKPLKGLWLQYPIITSRGEFRVKLQLLKEQDIRKYDGKEAICALRLAEGGRVSFTSLVKKGQFAYKITGMPEGKRDRLIKLNHLSFYMRA